MTQYKENLAIKKIIWIVSEVKLPPAHRAQGCVEEYLKSVEYIGKGDSCITGCL